MSATPSSKSVLPGAANKGFFGASHYDTYRPSYPPEAVEKLLSNLSISRVKNAKIVDLACGTGKFTELLLKRDEEFEVVAIDPHKEMREELVKKKASGKVQGNLKVLDGSATEMPVEDEWADACIAAQAFHWFATEEALREIHRVIRPGGAFGMIWNIEDYNAPQSWPKTTAWEKKMNDLTWTFDDTNPRFRHEKWRQAFESQLDTTPLQTLKDTFTHHMPTFSLPLGEDKVEWTVWLTEEQLWNRYSTLSQISVLDGEDRAKVRGQLSEFLKSDDVERNEKDEVAVHGVTFFAWTSRI